MKNWLKENWFKQIVLFFTTINLVVLMLGIVVFSSVSVVYAHPGRTDSRGGHTCRTNCTERWGLDYGEYHFHTPKPKPYISPPSEPEVKGVTKENKEESGGIGRVLLGIVLGGGGYWLYKKIKG